MDTPCSCVQGLVTVKGIAEKYRQHEGSNLGLPAPLVQFDVYVMKPQLVLYMIDKFDSGNPLTLQRMRGI